MHSEEEERIGIDHSSGSGEPVEESSNELLSLSSSYEALTISPRPLDPPPVGNSHYDLSTSTATTGMRIVSLRSEPEQIATEPGDADLLDPSIDTGVPLASWLSCNPIESRDNDDRRQALPQRRERAPEGDAPEESSQANFRLLCGRDAPEQRLLSNTHEKDENEEDASTASYSSQKPDPPCDWEYHQIVLVQTKEEYARSVDRKISRGLLIREPPTRLVGAPVAAGVMAPGASFQSAFDPEEEWEGIKIKEFESSVARLGQEINDDLYEQVQEEIGPVQPLLRSTNLRPTRRPGAYSIESGFSSTASSSSMRRSSRAMAEQDENSDHAAPASPTPQSQLRSSPNDDEVSLVDSITQPGLRREETALSAFLADDDDVDERRIRLMHRNQQLQDALRLRMNSSVGASSSDLGGSRLGRYLSESSSIEWLEEAQEITVQDATVVGVVDQPPLAATSSAQQLQHAELIEGIPEASPEQLLLAASAKKRRNMYFGVALAFFAFMFAGGAFLGLYFSNGPSSGRSGSNQDLYRTSRPSVSNRPSASPSTSRAPSRTESPLQPTSAPAVVPSDLSPSILLPSMSPKPSIIPSSRSSLRPSPLPFIAPSLRPLSTPSIRPTARSSHPSLQSSSGALSDGPNPAPVAPPTTGKPVFRPTQQQTSRPIPRTTRRPTPRPTPRPISGATPRPVPRPTLRPVPGPSTRKPTPKPIRISTPAPVPPPIRPTTPRPVPRPTPKPIVVQKPSPRPTPRSTPQCFTSSTELQTAVKAYLSNNGKNTAVAQKYGWPIGTWCVGQVTVFGQLFYSAVGFNEDISDWDTSSAVDMSSMFQGATAFNQNLDNWDVSKVTSTAYMFKGATSFNGNIASWNVGKVQSMSYMFNGAANFRQNLGSWNVASARSTSSMFAGALLFNQDLSQWSVSKVTDMSAMFSGALVFRQDLCSWGAVVSDPNANTYQMFTGTSCNRQGSPDLTASPSGPWCFACTPLFELIP